MIDVLAHRGMEAAMSGRAVLYVLPLTLVGLSSLTYATVFFLTEQGIAGLWDLADIGGPVISYLASMAMVAGWALTLLVLVGDGLARSVLRLREAR